MVANPCVLCQNATEFAGGICAGCIGPAVVYAKNERAQRSGLAVSALPWCYFCGKLVGDKDEALHLYGHPNHWHCVAHYSSTWTRERREHMLANGAREKRT